MTRTTTPFSDSFWSNSEQFPSNSRKRKKEEDSLREYLSSIDDSPEFYDPYSELNLFLSQKIKEEMAHYSGVKWSVKVQEELLLKISPEFQKKFPHYRLGSSALKKIWERVSYYAEQMAGHKEALTAEGKLNVDFLIKENLKQYATQTSSISFHPYHYAFQLATKVGECLGGNPTGCVPQLDRLAKTIWSIQRHLLKGASPEEVKSPYDEYDKVDKLIVKTILAITAREPQITHTELEHQTKEILHSLHELPSFSSVDLMTANISSLLAEKLYASSSFHSLFLAEQKSALLHFIRRHTSLCKTAAHLPKFSELIRRVNALYTLACQLPKNISKIEIADAVRSLYPIHQETRPDLPQPLYAFLSAELCCCPKSNIAILPSMS